MLKYVNRLNNLANGFIYTTIEIWKKKPKRIQINLDWIYVLTDETSACIVIQFTHVWIFRNLRNTISLCGNTWRGLSICSRLLISFLSRRLWASLNTWAGPRFYRRRCRVWPGIARKTGSIRIELTRFWCSWRQYSHLSV